MLKHDNIEQGTEAWHQLRKGKITGTTLKAIMGTKAKRQDAIYEMIADTLTVGVEAQTENENPMARGTRLEPEAIKIFEFETGKIVERTGFVQNDEEPKIAYSPDGLIGETEDIEVKCMGGKNHVKMWLTNMIPDDYYWQVVQAFVVNPKLQKRYFVGYHPHIPRHPLHIIEVTRESVEDSIEEARKSEQAFLVEVKSILETLIEL